MIPLINSGLFRLILSKVITIYSSLAIILLTSTAGVHNQVYNQYTLHTGSGCQVDSSKNVVGDLLASDLNANVFTGTILATNCDANQNYNSGCGISDTDPQSYGSGLEAAGGGVFATLWDNEGVRICTYLLITGDTAV